MEDKKEEIKKSHRIFQVILFLVLGIFFTAVGLYMYHHWIELPEEFKTKEKAKVVEYILTNLVHQVPRAQIILKRIIAVSMSLPKIISKTFRPITAVLLLKPFFVMKIMGVLQPIIVDLMLAGT